MRPTINPLTSLRGIAALLVVVNHMTLLMLPLGLTPAKPALTKTGILGMTTFFVLSGFVMYYNYAHRIAANRSEGILQFVFARVARPFDLARAVCRACVDCSASRLPCFCGFGCRAALDRGKARRIELP
jgi:peptidoglycan/LPS O-acetylase OafA/YrhL